MGQGFINIIIGNKTHIENNPERPDLVWLNDRMVAFNRLLIISFSPESADQEKQLRLVFQGGDELILKGDEATQWWERLKEIGSEMV
jgi:hypothetical protein